MATSRLADVNVLAIFLVGTHPGYPHVEPRVQAGLRGDFRPLVPSHYPLRARWILTRDWGVPREEADRAVRSFLGHPRAQYVGGTKRTLLDAFELAEALGHNVYDTHLLALALEHGAEGLLTTDTDFQRLCPEVGLEYENPVPRAVLARFRGFKEG